MSATSETLTLSYGYLTERLRAEAAERKLAAISDLLADRYNQALVNFGQPEVAAAIRDIRETIRGMKP